LATCSACGRSFPSEEDLQAHDREMHRGRLTGSAERMGERVAAGRGARSAARTRTVKVTEEEWRMIKRAREANEGEAKARRERRRETGKAY
jgi:hypothetical protein